MESKETRHSTVFPATYGDFALESSDEVICHFSRYLLGYMSQFFQDMFSLPVKRGNGGQANMSQQPLKVTEPAQVLELFLTGLDPKQQTPAIDPSNIVLLLEAAQKYQTPSIMEWFEHEVTRRHDSAFHSSTGAPGSFIATHVTLVLYCATRFSLPKVGQLALREFATCHISRIQPTVTNFDIPTYIEGLKLRETFRDRFDRYLLSLASTQATTRISCLKCSSSIPGWILGIERAVRSEPSWRVFVGAWDKCANECITCGRNTWYVLHRSTISGWEREVRGAERVLPKWPCDMCRRA